MQKTKVKRIQELVEKTKEIDRFLRKTYASSLLKRSTFNIPYGKHYNESPGAFIEVIYKGLPCPYSLRGTCTPCGYSNIPVALRREKIWNSLLVQTDYILKNFERIIIKNNKMHLADDPSGLIRFAIAPTGSFFSNFEIPPDFREKILRKVLNFLDKNNFKVEFLTEARTEDILNLSKREKKEIANILKKLNTTILLGFESIDDFVRNIIYCKDLKSEDFQKAVEIIRKDLKSKPGAFVFAGLHSMNEIETFNDVKKTLIYLRKKKILPVIMIAKLQSYTIPHLLYLYKKHKIIDPLTIHKIILFMASIFENRKFQWLFHSPVVGQPLLEVHAFQNQTRIACSNCSKKILKGILKLRVNYSFDEYRKTTKDIKNCKCFSEYINYLNSLKSKKSLFERVKENIEFAWQKKEEYLRKIQ